MREVKFPAIYFVWLIRRRSNKMKFFQGVLARIIRYSVFIHSYRFEKYFFLSPFQGLPGMEGTMGPPGPQGPSGAFGEPGTPGNVVDGVDGMMGPPGSKGLRGPFGDPGQIGPRGRINQPFD